MGVAVQALQVIGVYCIMYALHLQANEAAYILIFLLSSIVAVLPFTIGGLGAREIVFIWGSHHFLLDKKSIGVYKPARVFNFGGNICSWRVLGI